MLTLGFFYGSEISEPYFLSSRPTVSANNMKKIITALFVITMLFISREDAMAAEKSYTASASLNSVIVSEQLDNRAVILQEYLESKDSPLAAHADTFIETADKYNLDWRLVVSISGLESSFGKHQPAGSHNGWGWGYSNGTVKHFDTWDAAIEEISRGLRENYLYDRPYSDPYVIGPKYAASPTWAIRVTYFMNQLEAYKMRNSKSTLSLAL